MNEKYKILSVNGEFIAKADFSLPIENRAFRYGDGLFETMHANGQKIQFLHNHYNRLKKGANVLGLCLPKSFSESYLDSHIASLLNRCKLYQGAKVRIIVVRKTGGLYIPKYEDVDIIIEAEYLSKGNYELNKKGIILGVFFDVPKPNSTFLSFKSINALPYVLAGVYAKKNNFDDCLLVNNSGNIIEATSSNLFCIKDKTVYTPSLSSGCVDGVMRKNIIPIISDMGFEVIKANKLLLAQLQNMDEVFLTNAISGVVWVTGINNKRFYKRYAQKIVRNLNNQIFDIQ